MAAAISEYNVSSMLRETIHSAAESINQAVLSVETFRGSLEQSAVNYQKERAAEVEEAQKALTEDRQFHKKDELGLNFNSEA